ncbi:hypothetical protein [Desulfovibrio piger]|uniref:hypothetical protein n=1 Tax=Desulfovibrio piger TaxID=901 RepID=UPI001DDC45B2|nr:hypothetical protein [Desulfovibrio piger]HJG35839.1 hypothetical protein [Desulfovibrio piger]
MTLETTVSKAVYTGNGATTEFPFSFKVWDEDQILVSVTDAQGYVQETGEYSVTLSAGGGTVSYLHAGAPLPSGWKLAITRDMPFTQEDDYITGTRFDPEVIETGLDRATAERQQLREQLQRAVILPPTSDETPEDMAQELLRARDEAVKSAGAARNSEQAAADSASDAAASAQAAATSAEGADQSRAEAAASAAAASQSATAARQNAEAAAGSEDRAAQSAASILELQVEVVTLDPGRPASGDYDPETGILHLGIPKGDSGASAIATPTSLGSVMPQTDDEDGLELETDGKLRVRKATATRRGSVLASVAAKAGVVPLGGADGSLGEDWLKKALDAASAAQKSADGAQTTADEAKEAAAGASIYKKIAERSSTGNWTITGCTVGKPLKIYFTFTPKQASEGQWDEVGITTKSGADMSYMGSDRSFALGTSASDGWASTNNFEVIPTSTTVVLSVTYYVSGKLLAYN